MERKVIVMANMRLQKHVIEVVENQLKLGEPKCTTETYNEFIKLGHPKEEAKKLIAGEVLKEIYEVMKNNDVFNEDRYSKNLSDLLKEWGGKKIKWEDS